jgi:4-alpha-glucanotransferase
MERHGIQQLYVVQYEAQPHAEKPLRKPPAKSTASLNTHDMPPLAGFVQAVDLRILEELDVFDRREATRQKAARRAVVEALAQFFRVASPIQSPAAARRLARRCIEWLATSPARMMLVNLEDLWGETAAQNVPGTRTEQLPNWRRKARYSLEEFAAMPQVRSVLRKLHRLRERPSVGQHGC